MYEECRNEVCLNLNVKGPEAMLEIKLNCTEANTFERSHINTLLLLIN